MSHPASIGTMYPAPNAALTGCPKMVNFRVARSITPATAGKERALAMYQKGSSLSAIARIFGGCVPAVSRWVKGGRRTVPDAIFGAKSIPPARPVTSRRVAIACAELWTTGKPGARARGRIGGSGRQSVGRF